MRIYLAHAKANYASPTDGYVNAMRDCDYPLTLYSFHFITEAGRLDLPIKSERADADLPSWIGPQPSKE